ncbi:LysM peptidoglycan-binding domain-containing protein [Nesterenkonia sp. E16_7]|uniref:LysM peptidoglycan-binding domain-containing protein n=1 Tax=unclassified Nesterenkonia TaxID=2629769 RepID=UPI001A9260B3|nr:MULTISPECIES: LysM peptidoglycan-binding domain-containing protein [unclassified Nesterenkonia]MBO0596601.1 LysM peptidoglycan-binding domain-containing protein [Nesterenkonia sp. E16_10]MBO0598378.1 LysM peptidoglycan-binding domain-containing protein [Nesterenkonia sp. E16_7]
MATILSRTRWTTTQKGFPRISGRLLDPADIEELVPHWPAAGNRTYGPRPTLAETAAAIRAWRRMHIDRNGWADLGYPFVIDQAGRTLDGAGTTHAAAHAGGHNFRTFGVLFIVGNGERPSAAARAAFRSLGRHLKANGFPNLRTTPRDHGRLPGESTACAGPLVRGDVDAARLSFGTSTGGTTPAASGGTYTVQAGDTLSAIADANDASLAVLVKRNGISNADLIRAGQELTIPGSSAASSNDGTRAGDTTWPGRPLPQVFLARSNPFRSTAGAPLDNWPQAVPASHSGALFEYIRRAGFTPTSTTKWGHEELLRQWVQARHPAAARQRNVLRHGNNGAFGNPASIWAAVQVVLAGEGLYSGAADGQPGPATWWALTQRMNGNRNAYQ